MAKLSPESQEVLSAMCDKHWTIGMDDVTGKWKTHCGISTTNNPGFRGLQLVSEYVDCPICLEYGKTVVELRQQNAKRRSGSV